MPAPHTFKPKREQLYVKGDLAKPDLEFLKTHFLHEGRLEESDTINIITRGTEVLKKEQTLLDIDAPITGREMQRHVVSQQVLLEASGTRGNGKDGEEGEEGEGNIGSG